MKLIEKLRESTAKACKKDAEEKSNKLQIQTQKETRKAQEIASGIIIKTEKKLEKLSTKKSFLQIYDMYNYDYLHLDIPGARVEQIVSGIIRKHFTKKGFRVYTGLVQFCSNPLCYTKSVFISWIL